MQHLKQRLNKARVLSWKHFGKRITFYLPGMFTFNGLTGKYPAVSITGNQCALQCDHCKGKILASMIPATGPDMLLGKCLHLSQKGHHGVLISGGCTENGRLPWDAFISAIRKIKEQTNLIVSIHSGIIGEREALALKGAGVDQALIDVIGSDDTIRKMYHVPFGVSKIMASMEALQKAGLPIIPHIVCGLDYGEIKGEKKAVEMIAAFDIDQVAVVSLMRVPGTPAADASPPRAEEVADIIAETRFKMPKVLISLGCARQRGNSRLEVLAVDAGINRMALPSEEAVQRALGYGLDLRYQKTCCSVSQDLSKSRWQ
jgi:uncharacterized radical SAM superfamily protein